MGKCIFIIIYTDHSVCPNVMSKSVEFKKKICFGNLPKINIELSIFDSTISGIIYDLYFN